MAKKYYNINYSRLVLLLLPKLLRIDSLVSLLIAMIHPISLLHRKFTAYNDSLDIPVNCQTCYMQRMLNDVYDYYDRRIIVRDAPIDYDSLFLFSKNEGSAILIVDKGVDTPAPTFWVDNDKLGTTVADFEVVFPQGYVLSDCECKALFQLINKNKLASKKYNIVYE